MSNEAWTDEENDLIVADYFAMLADDIRGRTYSKTEHRRRLLPVLQNRSEGSIEFKHQNISAVIKGLGEDWIPGYKPAVNFQKALIDAVARWLAVNPKWLSRAPERGNTDGMADAAKLWIGPAPTLSNQPPPQELEQMLHIARKFNVAERDERNRSLGRAGEERVLAHERATLGTAGRGDLAGRIRWVSEEDGDGAGYDIASFEPDGRPRLIEVKKRTDGNARRSISPETNWQYPTSGAPSGACFGSGTFRGHRMPLSCGRRLTPMFASWSQVFRRVSVEN